MAHAFRACALAHPGRVLAAQHAGDEWISISWGAARGIADLTEGTTVRRYETSRFGLRSS
jgi:hypothetical protein